MDTGYVVAGINVVKCEHCGVNKNGSLRANGGNVFISVDANLYETIRHDCSAFVQGKCHLCGRLSRAKLIHPAAPKAAEKAIGQVVSTWKSL